MGGRSKSRSSNTSGATSSTMANLANKGVSNEKVYGMQQDLSNSQMGSVLGVVDALTRTGTQMFGDNMGLKIMGGMFGMPIQMQTPDFLKDFIAKYNPPEPAPPQTQAQRFGNIPTLPNGQPFDINQHMRNQFMR